MKILGISGSLRAGSYNTLLLKCAVELIGNDAEIEIFDISQIPFYNADIDGKVKPVAVQALLDAVAQADGLLLATPEYNYSVPGVLKNTIDWASRPAYKSVLAGKPTAIISASMSNVGGARSQVHLRDVLLATLTPIYPSADYLLAAAHHAFTDAGKLKDEASVERLQAYLHGFVEWARKVSG